MVAVWGGELMVAGDIREQKPMTRMGRWSAASIASGEVESAHREAPMGRSR
jgi:hypothetical protein